MKSKAGFGEVAQAPGHQVEYIIHEEHELSPAQTSVFREKYEMHGKEQLSPHIFDNPKLYSCSTDTH